MKAKLKLIRLFKLYGIQPWMLSVSKDKGIIFLKDNKKKFTPYKDTSFTNKAREDLQHINRHKNGENTNKPNKFRKNTSSKTSKSRDR